MADLRTDWADNIGMQVDAAFLNSLDTAVNTNTHAKPQYGSRSAMPSAATSNTGALYFCTDCDAVYQSDGTSWSKLRVGGQIAPGYTADPPSSGLTTTTLGSSTITADRDGRLLSIPASDGNAIRAEYKTLSPASGYTITAYFEVVWAGDGGSFDAGIMLTDGTKWLTYGVGAGLTIRASKWAGPSSPISNYFTSGGIGTGLQRIPNWQRIVDDGTNRKYQISYNGVDWQQLFSVGRTDHATPAAAGWGAQSGSTSPVAVRCRSFKITTP